MKMTTGDKKPPMPTTTAAQARLMLFQATRRPTPREQIIETKWGKVRIKARLGQQHADVLEAIFFCREKRKDMPDGEIKLLVDPAAVRRRSRQDGSTFKKITDDLQQAIVEIIEPAHLACQGQILGCINKAIHADGTLIERHNPLGGGRSMWSVKLGEVLSKLVSADIWLGYDPAPLAKMRHGVTQAIARHALTHKHEPKGGWILDNIILNVSGPLSNQQLRDRRREVKSDADKLQEVGLRIEVSEVSEVSDRPRLRLVAGQNRDEKPRL